MVADICRGHLPYPELWVSPSRLRAFKECPKRYDYAYNWGLTPVGRRVYFDKGNYTHEIMHVYYQIIQETGTKPGSDFLVSATLNRIKNDVANHTTADNVAIYNSVMKLMSRYIVIQSPKIDSDLARVVGVEHEVSVHIGTICGHDVYLYGYVDLIFENLRRLLTVRDHKTGQNPRAWSQEKLETDDQLLTYGTILWKNTGIAPRLEINFCNTYEYKGEPTGKQFTRYYYSPTEEVYSNFFEETKQLIEDMLSSRHTPHRSKECTRCPFYEPCRLSGLRGVSVDRILQTNYEVTDRSGPVRPKSFTENNTPEN
jgi:hypothetical protein